MRASGGRRGYADPRREEMRHKLGLAIRQVRVEKGLTQTELGQRLGGVPQTTVSHRELGHVDLAVSEVVEMERALDLRPGELLARAANPQGVGAPMVDPLLVILLEVKRLVEQLSATRPTPT